MKQKHNSNGWLFWLAMVIAWLILLNYYPTKINWVIFFLSLMILVGGVISIPNEPPHFALITRWGKRIWKWDADGEPIVVCADEGYHWLFLRGIMYGVILIDLSKREVDFPAQTVVTPDGGTTDVPTSLAYTLDPENIINFLDLGGKNPFAVLENMIDDIKKEKLRIWARSKHEGPQTWEEMVQSSVPAVKMLLETICGTPNIPDSDVEKIRSGFGKWPINHFGIILNRLNLTDMKPFGQVYEESIKLKDEERERKTEDYELETDLKKAQQLQTALATNQVNVSLEECMDKYIMKWKIWRESNAQLTVEAFAKTIAGAWKTGGSDE